MMNKLNESLKDTIKPLLEGKLRSELQLDDKDQKKEHVQKINDLNWSHAIAESNSKIEKWENINDIGSCSINIKKAKRSQTKNPFVTLEIGIIDVDNDIAFKIGSKKSKTPKPLPIENQQINTIKYYEY